MDDAVGFSDEPVPLLFLPWNCDFSCVVAFAVLAGAPRSGDEDEATEDKACSLTGGDDSTVDGGSVDSVNRDSEPEMGESTVVSRRCGSGELVPKANGALGCTPIGVFDSPSHSTGAAPGGNPDCARTTRWPGNSNNEVRHLPRELLPGSSFLFENSMPTFSRGLVRGVGRLVGDATAGSGSPPDVIEVTCSDLLSPGWAPVSVVNGLGPVD